MKPIMKLLTFLIVAVLSVAPVTTHAAEKALSLNDAIDMALKQNEGLLAARVGVNEASRQKGLARSAFMPRLNVSLDYMVTDNPVNAFGTKLNQGIFSLREFQVKDPNEPDDIDDYIGSAQLQIPIFNKGAEYIGLRMADEAMNLAEDQLDLAEEDIIINTIKAYYGVVLAQEGRQVAEDAVKTAEANLNSVKDLFEEGMVVKSDYLQAQVHVASMKEKLVHAKNQVQLAMSQFNLILGDSQGTYTPGAAFELTSCPVTELEGLQGMALQSREDLALLKSQSAMAKHEVAMAKSAFLPSLNAQASYDYHGENLLSDGQDSYVVGVNLSYNIFNGLKDKYTLAKAKDKVKRLEHQLKLKKDQIRLEVQQAHLNLNEAVELLDVTEQAIEQGKESLSLVTSRYNQNASTIVELLQAELALSNARMNRLQAHYNFTISQAELCRAVGRSKFMWEQFKERENYLKELPTKFEMEQ